MGICVCVTSGKGGTGKSTVSSALAFAFSDMQKRVLLIDLDEGLRCLDLMLGVDASIVFDLSDVLSGGDFSNSTYSIPNTNITLIPAPRNINSIVPDAFGQLIKKTVDIYDVVILDFPAGVDFTLLEAVGNNALTVAVCNPDPISVRDAAQVCSNLPSSANEPRLVINRFDKEFIKKGIYSNIDDIIDMSGIRLLGIIPFDRELMLLSVNHKLKRKGRALSAAGRIASRLCGNEVRLPNPEKI